MLDVVHVCFSGRKSLRGCESLTLDLEATFSSLVACMFEVTDLCLGDSLTFGLEATFSSLDAYPNLFLRS